MHSRSGLQHFPVWTHRACVWTRMPSVQVSLVSIEVKNTAVVLFRNSSQRFGGWRMIAETFGVKLSHVCENLCESCQRDFEETQCSTSGQNLSPCRGGYQLEGTCSQFQQVLSKTWAFSVPNLLPVECHRLCPCAAPMLMFTVFICLTVKDCLRSISALAVRF